MFLAGCGAIVAQLSLSRVHDRQLLRLQPALHYKWEPAPGCGR
jgi:hypothetical protein